MTRLSGSGPRQAAELSASTYIGGRAPTLDTNQQARWVDCHDGRELPGSDGGGRWPDGRVSEGCDFSGAPTTIHEAKAGSDGFRHCPPPIPTAGQHLPVWTATAARPRSAGAATARSTAACTTAAAPSATTATARGTTRPPRTSGTLTCAAGRSWRPAATRAP